MTEYQQAVSLATLKSCCWDNIIH